MDVSDNPTLFERCLAEWVAAEPGRTEGTFAELIGTSTSNLSRAKRGRIRADTEILKRACEELGLNADEVIILYAEGGHPLPAVLCGSDGVEGGKAAA